MPGDAPSPLAEAPTFDPAREATRLFRLAADETYSLAGVVGGLREIVAAISNGTLVRCDIRDLDELRAAIDAASGPASAIPHRLAPEAVWLGMGAAAGLVGTLMAPREHRGPADLILDRLDHVALLADELDADFRRRRIEARGDPLRRSIRIAVAHDTPAAGQPIQ